MSEKSEETKEFDALEALTKAKVSTERFTGKKERPTVKSIAAKYPGVFVEAGKFGCPDMSVGNGWAWFLEPVIKAFANANPPILVHQIKEKFGGLRIYPDRYPDESIHAMIRLAEMLADRTCELCGEPGKARPGGWIKTLCDKHHTMPKDKLREEWRKSED